MIRRLALVGAGLALAGAAAFWFATAPERIAAADLPPHAPDLANGERIFHVAGCASCHAPPGTGAASASAAGDDPAPALEGGLRLPSPFGVFVAPNITPDPDAGIGGWTEADFASAMLRGTSPEGAHYYPSFPYASYVRMTLGDVRDLKAYLDTLPASARRNEPHDLVFPATIRRGVGLWKALNLDPAPVIAVDEGDAQLLRGRYLVEGPGHCAECHTPRDAMGGLDLGRWMQGAPDPEGEGRVPDITAKGLADWSEADIAYALETGFTPDFDSLGGSMASVTRNTAKLPPEDRAAMAAYLKALPSGP